LGGRDERKSQRERPTKPDLYAGAAVEDQLDGWSISPLLGGVLEGLPGEKKKKAAGKHEGEGMKKPKSQEKKNNGGEIGSCSQTTRLRQSFGKNRRLAPPEKKKGKREKTGKKKNSASLRNLARFGARQSSDP